MAVGGNTSHLFGKARLSWQVVELWLTDSAKDRLRALNERSKSAVHIRTYEWLIDEMLAM